MEKDHKDSINHPSHYNSGAFEVIDVIEDWELDFHKGNAIKYIARAGKKDSSKESEDLKKAIWYLNRVVERIEGFKDNTTHQSIVSALHRDIATLQDTLSQTISEREICRDALAQIAIHWHHPNHDEKWAMYVVEIAREALKKVDGWERNFIEAAQSSIRKCEEQMKANIANPRGCHHAG
jgi:hypothetical protein